MNNLINKDTITSLELLEEINFFRKQEDRTETSHYDLLKIIRLEFDEEIGEGKISCTSTYKDSQGKDRPHGKLSEMINECLEEYFINNKNMQITTVGDLNDRNKQ